MLDIISYFVQNLQQIITFLLSIGLIGFIVNKLYSYYKERLQSYNLLVLFLIEINRKISRCEGMLEMWIPKKNIDQQNFQQVVSFANLTTPTFDKGWATLLDKCSDHSLVDDIAYIYEKFEFIQYNIKEANLIRVDHSKKDKIHSEVENSIIDSYRWGVAMAFIRNYLLILYKKYNRVYLALSKMKYSHILFWKIKKIGFNFPLKIHLYDRTYVRLQKDKLQLEEAHLDE